MNDELHFQHNSLSMWTDDDDYNNDKEIEINRNSIITSIILLNVLNCYNYTVINYAALIAQLI